MRDVVVWSVVAWAGWCIGFLCGIWRTVTYQERKAREEQDDPGDELEKPGLCRRCWGNCPPSGCNARVASDPPDISASDEWTALRVRFPRLTPAQLATVLERRYQERRQ